jgi:hypothetical protein
MKIGIMQPYFLPYIGYISLIKHTDRFILLDTVQFIRHGWIERNRILKPAEGWQYIQIPLHKYHQNTLIKDVSVNNDIDWKSKIIAQLQHYKRKAPFYKNVINLLENIFYPDYSNIVSLNYDSLQKVLIYLEIEKRIDVFSQMNLSINQVNTPYEWALNICKAIEDTDEYWNPPGGQSLFDKSKYDESKIKLKFQSIILSEYNQYRNTFENGLSILDVMMFNSVEDINKMLDNFELI